MKKIKIIKIVDKVKPRDRKDIDCIYIELDFGDGKMCPSYKNRPNFEVFMYEQKMLKSGINGKTLEKYKNLLMDSFDHERSLDDAGIDL